MIEGQGLHTGARGCVRFEVATGPLVFVQGGQAARRDELVVAPGARSTTVTTTDGRLRLATVEHLLAALAALGAHAGLRIVVEGPEIPLADGGAAAFFDCLAGLVTAAPPPLRVERSAEVVVGRSRYRFEVGDRSLASVEIDFGDDRLAPEARWDGTAAGFRARIAEARTFGFVAEIDELAARGLASHVSPESVVVIAREQILCAGPPFSADEPARHKLLDLLGDMFVHGGPPLGSVHAERPGHAATHEAMREALASGVVAPIGGVS